MAAIFSNITVRQSATVRSNETTGDFTPVANAVLTAWWSGQTTIAPTTVNIADSAGLSWTTFSDNAFNTTNRAVGWYALVGGSPSAMSVWFSAATAVAAVCYDLSQTTGANPVSPVVSASTFGAGGTSTTPNTGTVAAMSSAGNIQVLFVASRAASCSPEAGWVESVDTSVPAGSCHLAIYTIGTPGDTTPTATISSSVPWRARQIEFAESVGEVIGISTALRNIRRRRR